LLRPVACGDRPCWFVRQGSNALEKAQVPDLAIQKAAKGMGLLAIPVWPIIHQGMMAGGIASDSIDVVAQLLPGTGPMPHVRFVMPL